MHLKISECHRQKSEKESIPQEKFSRKGLKVDAKGSGPQDARMILQTAGDECYEVETEVEVSGENRGGMILFYNEKAFSGLMSDGNELVVYDNGNGTVSICVAYLFRKGNFP